MSLHALNDDDVRRLAPMAAVIAQTRVALAELQAGGFVSPQRHSFGDGASVVMPLYHPASGSVVVKTLTLDASREPLIRGAITWASSGDHHPVVAEAQALTAIRTGAIVGVAADLLADAEAASAVVFGVGGQSADQVRAVLAVRALRRVTLVSRSADRAHAAAAALATEFPEVDVVGATDARPALASADIVCCATNAAAPLFAADDLAEDVLVTAIGSYTPAMQELPQELLTGTVYVDDVDACLAEAGELIRAIGSGRLRAADLVPLGSVLTAMPSREGRRVFKSVGVAAQDWAIMHVLSRD